MELKIKTMTNNPATRLGFVNNPSKQKNGLTLLELLVVIMIIGVLVALLLPGTRGSRNAARRSECKNNLKQIGLALHNYAEVYNTFPPAYTVDSNGNRLHSWRTLILPYFDQKPLYDRIDLSKAWNDPANAEAFKTSINTYSCPSADAPTNHTTYLAVIAPQSFIHPANSKTLSEVTYGPAITLMVIEVDSQNAVHWMAPLDADENLALAFGPETELPHANGVQALFVDGRVQFLSAEMPAAERRSLIFIAGDAK